MYSFASLSQTDWEVIVLVAMGKTHLHPRGSSDQVMKLSPLCCDQFSSLTLKQYPQSSMVAVPH